MSHLRLYLWKEWRDQRSGTLGVLAALPLLLLLAGIAALAGERGFLREALRPGVAAAFGALLALFVIGTELLPGERRRRTLRFLERVPASLGAAFAAKLAYCVLTTALAAVYAVLLAASIRFLWEGTWPADAFGRGLLVEAGWLLPSMGIALWIFSVSAWVPRGTLAFPAAVLCLAILCWPAWILFGGVERLHPFAWEVPAFFVVCALGACVSAFASFVLGARRGGTQARSALFGIAAATIVLAPSWAWAAMRIDAHVNVDPASDDFRIGGGRLLDGGTRVEAWTCRELPWLDVFSRSDWGPAHALVVDFATGTFERATDEGDGARLLALDRPRVDPERFPWAWSGFARDRAELLDARRRGAAPADALLARVRAYPRWKPTVEDLGLPPGSDVFAWAGLGFVVRVEDGRESHTGFFDPFTCHLTTHAELARLGFEHGRNHFRIGPRGWLVEDTTARLVFRWMPDTPKPIEPLRSLAPGDRVVGMLADGRVLATGDGHAFVVDLERDARADVAIAGGAGQRVDTLCIASGGLRPLEFAEPVVLRLASSEGNALTRFDPETLTLHPTARARGPLELLGCPDDDHAIAIEDRRRIVRLAFDGTERSVLFPRAAAAP